MGNRRIWVQFGCVAYSSYFSQDLNSTPICGFEKVTDGYPVIQDLIVRDAASYHFYDMPTTRSREKLRPREVIRNRYRIKTPIVPGTRSSGESCRRRVRRQAILSVALWCR